MRRTAMLVFFGCVSLGSAARGDVWDDYVTGGGLFEILGSSALIDTPWGPPVLHRTGGAEALCAGKPFGSDGLTVDGAMFGIPSRLWLDFADYDEVGFPTWTRFAPHELCLDYMGRVTLGSSGIILNGRLKALPAPRTHRCDELPATLSLELGTRVMSPEPDARPGTIRIYFSYGCGADRVPSMEPIRITDFQAEILTGGQPINNWPRIVDLEAPAQFCTEAGDGTQLLDVTVRLSEPVSGRDFLFTSWAEVPGALRTRINMLRGEAEYTYSVRIPPGALGDMLVIARSLPGPDGRVTGASEWVEVLSETDPVCLLRRLNLGEAARWEPRWDGCWNCRFSISGLRAPRIINQRMVLGPTTRLLNGVVARNAVGLVASVSENTAGVPTSLIMLGDQVLHALHGIRVHALNDLGGAVGTRLDPKGQVRAAVWFDGQNAKELGTLGGSASEALALSGNGWIAGWAEDGQGMPRAFISRDGGLEAIPLPPHLQSEATSIGGERWVSGNLLSEEGWQGFLFDLETGAVHLTEFPEEGAGIAFLETNGWGRTLGTLTTHNQQVVPIVFSADVGMVRLDQLAEVPEGFVPLTADGLTHDGSVFVSGMLEGERVHLRFSP